MTKIALIAGGQKDQISGEFDSYVAVDRACLFLIEQHLPLDLAVGDFDSVSPEEKAEIQTYAKEMVGAIAEKNDTDTELALEVIFERYPDSHVTIFGAFGGRLDHTLANVFLPSESRLAPFMRYITLVDQQNQVTYYPSGTHQVQLDTGYPYLSFLLSSDEATLRIIGAKYPLSESNFFFKKIYVSNEPIGETVEVQCDQGYLIVIQSKDKE